MRTPAQGTNRRQVAQTVSVSSPVGGLNARDPWADMKPTDALILDNLFCTPYDVRVREGYSKWATGLTGNVETLMSYSPPSGSLKFFACANNAIYDITTAGAVGSAVQSGLSNNRWQHVNFGTAGGNFLFIVNGADAPRYYDGTTWTVPVIHGLTTTNIANVTSFKSRLWFCEKNTAKVWYLPILSIAGTAKEIDFSSLLTRGGYIMAMGNWSLDAGYGMDDYAVFVSSEGQVLIYKGTDPDSASTWALIGIYDIGSPIGRRCLTKYAGDVLVICQDGIAPLSQALMSSRVNSKVMLTDKIQHIASEYVALYGANFGWDVTLFPKGGMILLNVPVSSTQSYQLVMNTISGAWSRFTNMNASTFELHGDNLYFGGNGVVYKALDTNADDGNNIDYEALQAFNYFGKRGQLKQAKMVRPILSVIGDPNVLLGVNADSDTTKPTGVVTTTSNTGAKWDSAVWDSSVWADDQFKVNNQWQTAFAMGYSLAAHIVGSGKNFQMRWNSTDFLLQSGGVI